MRPLQGLRQLTRSLHTQAPRFRPISPRSRVGLVAAGSIAATIVYLTWRTSNRQPVLLDSSLDDKTRKRPSQPRGPIEPPSHPSDALSDAPGSKSVEKESTEYEKEIKKSGDEADESEESESEGGAFNPVTGEINWDCPCLGGMAHGPCGPQFREAFSCFVYSEEEPKGINCVEKFKAMQDCFREHPELYGEEIMEDDEEDSETSTSLREDSATDTSAAPAVGQVSAART